MNLSVDIGGLRIAFDGLGRALEAEVRERYRRFLVDAPGRPDLTLTLTPDPARPHDPPEIPRVERAGERRYAIAYGALVAEIDLAAGTGQATLAPIVYLVDSLLRISTTLLALDRDALVVHSSGVRVNGPGDEPWALVCFGPSGAGKTTIARSVAPAEVLCDEMILLRTDGDRVTASGTPFHGDLPVCGPGTLPVPALVQLRQGNADALTPLSDARAAQALLGSVLFFCRDEAVAERLLGLALRICAGRTYTLTFQRETHVPTFVASAIFG